MDTKTRSIYMLSTRDPLQTYGHTQTESEGIEKDLKKKRIRTNRECSTKNFKNKEMQSLFYSFPWCLSESYLKI